MAFGKRDDPDQISFWVNRLEPLASQALYTALGQACEGERMPALRAIVTAASGSMRANQWQAPPQLTEAEKKKSDHWAIISMLWLHYTRPHAFAMCEDIFARLFGGDPHQALAKAKEIYSKEEIEKLMTARLAEIDRRDEELRRVPA